MLTTLSTVKTRLRLDDSDVRDDALLTNFIALASARFENDANRSFGIAAYHDEFQGDETELRVKAYPIFSVTSLSLKTTETEGWVVQSNIDYIIRRNCLLSLRAPLGTADAVLRLSYSGGFNLPGDIPEIGVTALPDDLQLAAVEQIAYWYQNKDRLGITSLSGSDGSISQFSKLDLLPIVSSVLAKFERYMP